MNEQIQNLINELEHIAKKNKDKFRYSIEIAVKPRGLIFEFEAEETADGHTFLNGSGSTIEEAIANAHKNVPDAVEEWGYEV